MADDQILPQSGGNTGSDPLKNEPIKGSDSSSGSSVKPAVPKKPKTEQQKAKERERRKRRRRKKSEAGFSGEMKPGMDVPLILPSKAVNVSLEAPADSKPVEEKEVPSSNESVIQDESVIPKQETKSESIPEIQAAPQIEPEPEHVPEVISEPEPVQAPESLAPELPVESDEPPVAPEVNPPSEQIQPPEPHLDDSQQIFEEAPAYHEEAVKPDESHIDEQDEHLKDQPEEITPVEVMSDGLPDYNPDAHADLISEEELENNKKDAAKEVMADLHGEDAGDGLAEVPQKEWIIGNLLKTIAGIVAVLVLIVAAFWVGSSLHLPDLVKGLFAPKAGQEQLAVGDNTKVVVDSEMIQHWGFLTAQIFSKNLGDTRDLGYNMFFVADYFGKLKDPVFYGETGITAGLYYGFGKETQYFANKFIFYVKYLGQIRQANLVNVNDVLNGKIERDKALDAYIANLQTIFDGGNNYRKEINVQVDDLQISINSLTADHDRYQTDFFNSVEQIQGEKANELIQSFIENSQKQVELKAKMAGLARLSQDYNDDLVKMKLRLEGLQKNRAALITGVTVTPVPGSDINLVNQ